MAMKKAKHPPPGRRGVWRSPMGLILEAEAADLQNYNVMV
jgi:hypothetical protein